MKSDSALVRQETVSSRITVDWKRISTGVPGSKDKDTLTSGLFSGFLKEHGENVKAQAAEKTKGISDKRKLSSLNEIRLSCLEYLFYLLFSKRKNSWGSITDGVIYDGGGGGEGSRSSSYSEESFRGEYESLSYSTEGVVRTADGRELSFNLSFEATQSFEEYYSASGYSPSFPGSMTDPLVINLEEGLPSLSDQKFTFDLDADGEEENISMPTGGSAFLALDQNENGRIDDGSELFGAKTGSGFKELAAYDEDHNGWIDENDEIFQKLRLWVKEEDGTDRLYSLKDKGLGAICLQALPASYSCYGSEGELQGMVRNSSFFLYENGRAGTIQHLDLSS